MANVTFNGYVPEPVADDAISVTLGVFFDGTKNNKNNTSARKGKKEGEAYDAYKEYGGSIDENISYNNDWSNIARLWDNYQKTNAIYIEGIGTVNLGDDEMDGYAYGSKDTIISKKNAYENAQYMFEENYAENRLKSDFIMTSDIKESIADFGVPNPEVYELYRNKFNWKPMVELPEGSELIDFGFNNYNNFI